MAKKQLCIGVDIGGTKMAAVLFDGERVLMDFSLATPKDNLNHMLVMLKALIEPLEEKAKATKSAVRCVGIGVAGEIDRSEGRIIYSPNLEYLDGVRLAEKASKFIGFPVTIDNDANCFLRAEMRMGSVKKFTNVYGITLGTGIGGSWCHDGKIYDTKYGGSGEPGKMIIDFATGMNLEEAYQKIMQNNPSKMAEEAYRGDVLALKAYEEFGEMLGIALTNITNILAPDVFVIGGSVIESAELFIGSTKKTLRQHIDSDNLRKKMKIVESKVGADAGAVGAALLSN